MRDHWGYERRYCPSCGVQYIVGQKFCQECGMRLEEERVTNIESGIYTDNPDDAMRYIASCDRVESVDVVLCKDCIHTCARTADGENFHCGMFNLWMRHDFYCKYGMKSETKALVCSPQNMSTVMSSGMDTAIRYERANHCSDGEKRSK